MTEKEYALMERAILTYGEDSQKMMMIEECSELINALTKEKRGRVTDAAIIEELADVTIMLCQMSIIYGGEKIGKEIDYKLKRLQARLDSQC